MSFYLLKQLLLDAAMNFGKRAKAARERAGLTQEELADMVPGLNQGAITAYETRDSKSNKHSIQICKVLGVDHEEMITGEKSSKKAPKDIDFAALANVATPRSKSKLDAIIEKLKKAKPLSEAEEDALDIMVDRFLGKN